MAVLVHSAARVAGILVAGIEGVVGVDKDQRQFSHIEGRCGAAGRGAGRVGGSRPRAGGTGTVALQWSHQGR